MESFSRYDKDGGITREWLSTRGPLRKVTKFSERVQTYHYWVVLECGHLRGLTRSARMRGVMPKRMECYNCKEQGKDLRHRKPCKDEA